MNWSFDIHDLFLTEHV